MTLKEDIQAYVARWKLVEEVQREERRNSTMELRWRQLNAAYALAKGLGLLRPDPTEMEVFERWAILKAKAIKQDPEA